VKTELLGDICDIQKGRKATEVFDRPVDGAHRYLQIDDLREETTRKFARDARGIFATCRDVVIAWDGANAGTAGFNLEGYIGSTLAALKPKSEAKIFAPYLGQFLRGKFDYLQARTTGATIPHLDRDALESIALPLPALSEQKRIAAILEKADRLRRVRGYARQLSDTFLQSVFLEMFAGNESREWPQSTIDDLAAEKPNAIRTGPFGSQLLHSEFVNEGIAVLGIDNAVQNCFVWAKPRFITQRKYAELKRYTVSPGDVLITLMGTCGRCAVVPDDIPLAINTKHLCCISLNQTRCLPTYLHACFLNHPHVLRRLGISERGAVMPGLNMQLIKELAIPVPPLSLQQKFAAIVRRFERLRAQQREAERQAEHLFQTLLHRAFSGEITSAN
jgi:type I restriction enzyme, S subunit